ncbi:cytochrome P450 [Lojkania enalia]|uniref:Cytochrome P450 n=1 Tax=Lojkania enalia TaxID=147567 RepID=A0A9P4NAS2_9PLEO|nr:cytochrome P450 [Didymosphaeria enalia]
MNKVFRENAPTYAIVEKFFGKTKAVYTIQPENIKTVLSTNFTHFHRPRTMPNALDPVMGQGVFTSNGEAWAHSRGLVRAQFSSKRVRNVAKLEGHVQNMWEAMGEALQDGWTEEQEILLIYNRFTLDAATEFMFGTSAESHEVAMREKTKDRSAESIVRSWVRKLIVPEDFGTAFDTALDYVALRLKLGRLWFMADGVEFRLACYKVRSYCDNYIRRAVAHAEAAKETAHTATFDPGFVEDRRFGLISELVHSYPDKVALRNQVMQLLVAGRDTTAASLCWTMILLDAHPEVFTRLRVAIEKDFGTEAHPLAPVTFENLKSCTYLQWVIFEVLRLYPTGPLNARKATIDTVLPVGGGADGKNPIAIRAGSTVVFNTYLMHRWEELWGPDSWEFKPERWEDRKTGWEYIPFFGGPQTCLGQQHALTEMAYVITRFLQRYDNITSSTRQTNRENGIRTILVPKRTVLFRFHKRTS